MFRETEDAEKHSAITRLNLREYKLSVLRDDDDDRRAFGTRATYC